VQPYLIERPCKPSVVLDPGVQSSVGHGKGIAIGLEFAALLAEVGDLRVERRPNLCHPGRRCRGVRVAAALQHGLHCTVSSTVLMTAGTTAGTTVYTLAIQTLNVLPRPPVAAWLRGRMVVLVMIAMVFG
jgi:hypothetical protein